MLGIIFVAAAWTLQKRNCIKGPEGTPDCTSDCFHMLSVCWSLFTAHRDDGALCPAALLPALALAVAEMRPMSMWPQVIGFNSVTC